eukprot:175529_1
MNVLNSRTGRVTGGIIAAGLLYKLYSNRKHNQTFNWNKQELQKRAILITGCDTGFGHELALSLNNLGYTVIATCLTKQSVSKFMSSTTFTQNSVSYIMDVTNIENIKNVSNKIRNYLSKNNKSLYGIVNNAGIAYPGPFEMVNNELTELEFNVVLFGAYKVIREFLPLIRNNNLDINNKGRIINIGSEIGSIVLPSPRYGVAKSGLSYFTHGLRMELYPKFKIWCALVEPGPHKTNAFNETRNYIPKIKSTLNNDEIWNAYDGDKYFDNFKKTWSGLENHASNNVSVVIDDIIHALNAKYPKTWYCPGWNPFFKILYHLPKSLQEAILLKILNRNSKSKL